MAVAEQPAGDSSPRVRLVELASGRSLTLLAVSGAHLG